MGIRQFNDCSSIHFYKEEILAPFQSEIFDDNFCRTFVAVMQIIKTISVEIFELYNF